MKQVCVLGNGQLGRMLRQAGEPLGIAVWPVGLDAEPTAVPVQQSVITAEIERWPETALTRELARHPAFVNRDVFPIIADRLTQKQLFDKLGLATAPWQLLTSTDEWSGIFDRLGELAIIKRRVGGYDGRGQWRLRADETGQLPDDCYGECIVERGIHFSGEVSLVGARAHDGSTVFYPLTHNLHQNGILRTSVAFPQANAEQQEQAESMLSAIMQALNYVGVMAMECFITPEGLLINELAPRVHNSGHWTQNGASISQFELHLRAITGLPLPAPVINAPSVMINLIGSELNYDWLKLPLVHLHWYDKAVRPGRKVGHLNLTDSDTSRLSATLEALSPLLPGEYASGIIWARKVSLNKQRGRRILCRRPSRSQRDAGSRSARQGIVNTRQCANPCRLSAPLHIPAYRGHLRPHRAIGFGKRRQLIGRSLTNSALLRRSPMFIHRIRIRQNNQTIGRYLLRQQCRRQVFIYHRLDPFALAGNRYPATAAANHHMALF